MRYLKVFWNLLRLLGINIAWINKSDIKYSSRNEKFKTIDYSSEVLTMKFASLTIIVVLYAAIGSEACLPWQGCGVINVCKSPGKTTNCIGVSSGSTCMNLIGGPFVSGFTSGDYRCTVYSAKGCGGSSHTVDKAGWSRFVQFTPKSIKCPCVWFGVKYCSRHEFSL